MGAKSFATYGGMAHRGQGEGFPPRRVLRGILAPAQALYRGRGLDAVWSRL